MIKFENFETFVLRKLERTYGQFYTSYEEYEKHFRSGEVTVPVTHMFKLQTEYVEQLPCQCDEKSAEEIEQEVLALMSASFKQRHASLGL